MASPIDDLKAIAAAAATPPTHVYGVVTERVMDTRDWFYETLATLFGTPNQGEWECYEEPARGPVGGVVVRCGTERGFVDRLLIVDRDPVRLMDCFRCAACGTRLMDKEGRNISIVDTESGNHRTRHVCSNLECASPRAIASRDEHLGIPGDQWQCGAHGAELTPRMSGTANASHTPPEHEAQLERMARAGGFKPTQPPLPAGSSEKCSCCGERDADEQFPGLTDSTRDVRGRPIATLCFVALLGEGKGARALAERIRARDAALAQGDSPCV